MNRLPAVRLRIPALQSIGVVTFNGDEQRLIENQARRSDPSLEAHFDGNQTNEPVLVKNIENVQGDERDVIIFSVAVGPDKNDRITAQISSPNNEGRARRGPAPFVRRSLVSGWPSRNRCGRPPAPHAPQPAR